MHATPAAHPLAPPAQIAEIIVLLCQTITDRLRIRVITPAQVQYIVRRLLGISKRFRRLAGRIEAGRIPRERVAPAPRPRPADSAAAMWPPLPRGWRRMKAKYERMAETPPPPPWRALRQGRGWLVRLAPQIPAFVLSAPSCRARLEMALDEPGMRALLMASRRVGDALRPLSWMLAIDVSRLYPARPPAAAAEVAPVAGGVSAAAPPGEAAHANAVPPPPDVTPADRPEPGPEPENKPSAGFSNSA